MAAPQVRGVGAFAYDTTLAIQPGITAQTGDLVIAVLEFSQTATVAGTTTVTENEYTQQWDKLFEEAEGDGASGVTALAVWACIWDTSKQTSGTFSVVTAQNHIHGQLIAVYDHGVSAPATDLVVGTGAGKTGGYDITIPGITVDADSLILGCLAVSDDGNDTDNITSFTNANLTGLTERFDQSTNSGAGGGICCWTGACAGTSSGDSTARHDNTASSRYVHIGIPPVSGGPWTGSIVFWPDDDMG